MGSGQVVVQLVNGISYGFLLFLLAAGLSLVFGLMGVVNLAHGSSFMLGAYVGFSAYQATNSLGIAALAGGTIAAFLGMGMERFFLRRIYRTVLEQVLLTFGFAYILMDFARIIWGPNPQTLNPPSFLAGSVALAGVSFPVYRLAIILIGLVIVLVLSFFMDRTRLGSVIRAGVDDREMVSGLGINVTTVFTMVFALGALLAGLGGVLGAPILGIYRGLDFDTQILALVVVVVGGLGTIRGALMGSLLIGLVDTFGKAVLPNFAMFTIYVVMALVLVFKPSGLLGKGEK